MRGARVFHDFIVHSVRHVSRHDRHQPILLHRQVEHLHQDLFEEESFALRSRGLGSLNVFGFSSALRLDDSLRSWRNFNRRARAKRAKRAAKPREFKAAPPHSPRGFAARITKLCLARESRQLRRLAGRNIASSMENRTVSFTGLQTCTSCIS